MKKLIVAALAVLALGLTAGLSTPASAKGAAHKGAAHVGKHQGAKLTKMSTALGLTDAQKTQIKPILQSAHQQAKAVKGNTTLTAAEKKAQIKTIHKGSRAQILAVLTPEQRTKLKAMKHQHKNKA